MEATRRDRVYEPLPEYWPVALTGPLTPGQDKLQALLTAVFLQEQTSKRRQAEEKLAAVQEALSALIRLQREVTDSADLDAAARFASFRALEVTPAISVAIAFAQGDKVICRASAGAPATVIGTALDLSEGLLAECVRTAHLQLCYDTEADERVNVAACRALGVRSVLAVPILSQARVLGLLATFASLPRAFHEEHVTLLETIASMLATRTSAQVQRVQAAPQPQPVAPRLRPEDAEVLLARSAPPPRNWTRTLLSFAAGTAVLLAVLGVSLRGFIERDIAHASNTQATDISAAPPSPSASRDSIDATVTQAQAEHTVVPSSASETTQAPPAEAAKASPGAAQEKRVGQAGSVPTIDALRERAITGDPDAQFQLGVKYAAGSGVPADQKQAAKWIASAAGQGNSQAEQMLGDFCLLGRGVPKDLMKAYAWSAKAAAAGNEAGKSRMTMLKSVLTPQQEAAGEKLAAQPNLASTKH